MYLAFTNGVGQVRRAGATSSQTAGDFRFVPAVEHVALYLVLLAGQSHRVRGAAGAGRAPGGVAARPGRFIRFAYYIPGALAGASSVLLWLFVLDPTVSPVVALLQLDRQPPASPSVIAPGHLPIVFAIIAFWTGAGGWIVVMYGALNTIPADVLEAARVDGAGPWSDRLAHRSCR